MRAWVLGLLISMSNTCGTKDPRCTVDQSCIWCGGVNYDDGYACMWALTAPLRLERGGHP